MVKPTALILSMLMLISLFSCTQNTDNPAMETSVESESLTPPDESAQTQPATEGQTEEAQTEPIILDPILDPSIEDDTFVRVSDHLPMARISLRYATRDNFTNQRIYDFADAYLRYGTVKKLAQVSIELAEHGAGLLIWDAFRPLSAQTTLYNACPDPNFVSSPTSGSLPHCRGGAVDLTLYDLKTGKAMDMPSDFDAFDASGNRDYSDCTEEQAKNATLLETAMEKHGFRPYSEEWWHFSDTDPYPIEQTFSPQIPLIWIANCQTRMSLRPAASTTGSIGTVLKDEEVTLLGFDGKFAKVNYNGKIGYLLSGYIKPKQQATLPTVKYTSKYTYEQMLADIDTIANRYPDLVTADVIGKSEEGRNIPVLRIGNENAEHHVLLQGAIHGREHMTAWLLMALVDEWVGQGIEEYGDICYHVIPMTNPDGVIISQTKTLNEEQIAIYKSDKAKGYTTLSQSEYAAQWKANANGVDLNRNFPSGWESILEHTSPSSERYRGTSPFCAKETAALRDYTNAYPFDITISYHASGSLIYYDYGNNKETNEASKKLAQAIESVTGYPLEPGSYVDGAGYKDWAIDELSIPSLTIEIGTTAAPLPERELYAIFARNRSVLPEIARFLQKDHS